MSAARDSRPRTSTPSLPRYDLMFVRSRYNQLSALACLRVFQATVNLTPLVIGRAALVRNCARSRSAMQRTRSAPWLSPSRSLSREREMLEAFAAVFADAPTPAPHLGRDAGLPANRTARVRYAPQTAASRTSKGRYSDRLEVRGCGTRVGRVFFPTERPAPAERR